MSERAYNLVYLCSWLIATAFILWGDWKFSTFVYWGAGSWAGYFLARQRYGVRNGRKKL